MIASGSRARSKASRDDDLAAAVSNTDELTELAQDDRFGDALSAEGLTVKGLAEDRAWFETRMRPGE